MRQTCREAMRRLEEFAECVKEQLENAVSIRNNN